MTETILIPVGCIESHGLLPDNTDTLIAQAFCQMSAEMLDIDMASIISHGFCPTTSRLPETEVIGFKEVFDEFKEAAVKFVDKGMRYIVFINIHGGNDVVLKAVVQDIFIQRMYPVMYFNPYTAFADELDSKYFKGKDNNFKEISLLQASCEALGLDFIKGPNKDQVQERDHLLEHLKKRAVIGFSYIEPTQHIAWRNGTDAVAGRKYLEEVTKFFKGVLKDFKICVDKLLGKEDG